MSSIVRLAAVLMCVIGLGCDDDDDGGMDPPVEGDFSSTVLPVLQQHCATSGCHAGSSAPRGLELDSYDSILAGSDDGEAVIPFSPAQSLMIELLEGRAGVTPDHSALLPGDDLSTLRGWITDGCLDDDGTAAFADATSKIYVTGQGADLISIIHPDDLVVMRLLTVEPFAGSIEALPHFGTVSADNSIWITTMLKAPGVWKYDSRDSVLAKLQTAIESPALTVLTPDAGKAYVTHFIEPQMPGLGHVSVISMGPFEVARAVPVLNTPHGIAISSDGSEVYVGNWGSDHITVIDTDDDSVVEHIPVSELVRGDIDSFDYRVIQVAAHPSQPLIYVSCTISPGAPQGEVRVIDRTQGTVVDSLALQAGTAAPWHLKVTRDGSKLYVANRGQQLGSGAILQGSVSVYSTQPFAHITTITDPSMALPHGLDFDDTGRYCFVSSENLNGAYEARHPVTGEDPPGTVAVIDTMNDQLVKVLEVEAFATGVFATR